MVNAEQREKVKSAKGFLAALDQSGGSTPKALKLYGVTEDMYTAGSEEMFEMVHTMRTRIMTSPSFGGDRIVGAILFENTMDRMVEGKKTADYLWETKNVVPFLKCDKGLAELSNGVQVMKPMPALAELLTKAVEHGIFGTKMRSVIKEANAEGIKAVVDQQFEIGKQIIAAGLTPIIEPEVDINSPDKTKCEEILKGEIMAHLDALGEDQIVMLKLTLPSVENYYKDFVEHPKVLRVVALSGGYPRDEANRLLSLQTGIIGSFSRALTEGLQFGQTKEEFDKMLNDSIQSICDASG